MFTQEQLQLIKNTARKVKNQGELAVSIKLWEDNNFLTAKQWTVLDYCAEECKRQRSGELSVYWMVNAWNYAVKEREDMLKPPDELDYTPLPFIELMMDIIPELGKLVEPYKNKKGFRTIPIGVGNRFEWHEKAQWERVPELLKLLLESYYEGNLQPTADGVSFSQNRRVTALRGLNALSKSAEDEFYFQYENIHPFVDGNGRTGKILYNYLLGKLDAPIMPPNFFDGSNP